MSDIPHESIARINHAVRTDRKKLFDFIRRRVRTTEDAEDILQDVFYQLLTSYDVTEPITKMTSWLFTVARNKIIDRYRKKREVSFDTQERPDDEALPLNLEHILFDPRETPDQLFTRSLVWEELADALDDLPDAQRDVFVMHELEGKSFNEISELTGASVNTLLSRKRYAVLMLRERLQDLYDEMKTL